MILVLMLIVLGILVLLGMRGIMMLVRLMPVIRTIKLKLLEIISSQLPVLLMELFLLGMLFKLVLMGSECCMILKKRLLASVCRVSSIMAINSMEISFPCPRKSGFAPLDLLALALEC
jgi:hypothetical protein